MVQEFKPYDSDAGSLFIQIAGPNSVPEWLYCVDMGDVDMPQGDVNREWCPDPSARGKWIPTTRTQGAPGEVTFDFTVPLGPGATVLHDLATRKCPVSFYVIETACGGRTDFLPMGEGIEYRGTTYRAGLLTSRGRSNVVMSGSDGSAPTRATETFSISSRDDHDFFALVPTRRTSVSVGDTLDVAFWTKEQCLSACGAYQSVCEDGVVVEANTGAAIADLYFTADGGVTWTVSAALPFAVSEAISTVVVVWMNAVTPRIIVGRGTTDGANECEIAYTEDLGVTWTTAEMGSTNGEFLRWNGSLFALDKEHIWAATDTGAGAGGNVFFSSDGGVTWTLQTALTDAANAIYFANENVGLVVCRTNDIFKTLDGGLHWDAVAGPAAQAVADCLSCGVVNSQQYFVGYDDGELWFTQDGGTTWSERAIPVPDGHTSVDAINAISMIDDHCWWFASAGTGGNEGALHRTVDGGYSWESWSAPAAIDINSLHACNWNKAVGVGDVAVTTMIMDVGA